MNQITKILKHSVRTIQNYLKEEKLINEMKNIVGNLTSENYKVLKEKIEKILKNSLSI